MITRKQICKAIFEETGLEIKIYKVKNDYFYFYSDDLETGLMLCSLESTVVYSTRLSHQSVSDWVNEFKRLISVKGLI